MIMSTLLLADNKTAYLPIVTGKDACQTILTAANELAHYLRRITGAVFQVVQETDAAEIRFLIDKTLEEEEFVIQSCSCCGLKISGGTARGVLYGVYGLLEDVLGVKFYTPDVTKIPTIETLELEDMTYTDKPVLEYRQVDYLPCMVPEWRAHNRINGQGGDVHCMDAFGGMKSYALFVHTFYNLVNPDIYFDEHPEYFSLVNGERKRHSQLCLTNPEVIAIAVENVKKTLREHPEATLISVSQNDVYFPCECPECAKMDAENESHAGTLIYFVNAVAEAIEEEFPHVVVDTLAYQYARKPPKKIKPRHNVCVRLCSIECCFGHPLEECNKVTGFFQNFEKTSKRSFQEDLIGWGEICKRIYIWDYVNNYEYYWLHIPNFHTIGPNMKFFVKNGVKGVYEEGNYQSVSPDMTEMRTWLLAKLLWNPDFNVMDGIYEFTEAVYGPAAPEIREYVETVIKRVQEGNIHFGIYEQPDIDYFDPATLAKAQELIAAAQAKELTLSQRIYVEKVALSIEFTTVGQDVMKGKIDVERIDRMMDKARTLGITQISESWRWNNAVQDMMEGRLFVRNW